MKTFNLLLIVVMTALAGCVRSEDLPTDSTYTFKNGTGEQVTMDLYNSVNDYNNGTNAQQHFVIPVNGTVTADLKVGDSYWLDWYTADYSLTNWGTNSSSNNALPAPLLKTAVGGETRTISASRRDTARSVLLNGGGSSSTWKGTIANGGNWDGTHVFTFRKDMTYEHIYTALDGTVSRFQFDYAIFNATYSGNKMIAFMMQTSNQQSNLAFRFNCYLTPGTGVSGRDSMTFFSFISSGGSTTYLVRQ